MIVRIQGDGQYRLDESAQAELSSLDAQLFDAVKSGGAEEAHNLLTLTIALVHNQGSRLAEDDLSSSDLILPSADASLDETRALLQSEGLVGA